MISFFKLSRFLRKNNNLVTKRNNLSFFSQDELEDGDEIPLTSKKTSKKFSVDSIKGLDDFRTKSFDETWVTGKFVKGLTIKYDVTMLRGSKRSKNCDRGG